VRDEETKKAEFIHTFVIENATIFQGKYAIDTILHVAKVMADFEPNKVT
jgi:hypothetical protein